MKVFKNVLVSDEVKFHVFCLFVVVVVVVFLNKL